MMPQTNPLETPPDAYALTLPDGRVTTLESLIGDARRARSAALGGLIHSALHRGRDALFALLAPMFGVTRRRLHP